MSPRRFHNALDSKTSEYPRKCLDNLYSAKSVDEKANDAGRTKNQNTL